MNRFFPYWNYFLTALYTATSVYAGYEMITAGSIWGGMASIYTGVVFAIYFWFICVRERRLNELIARKEETIARWERLYDAFKPKDVDHES